MLSVPVLGAYVEQVIFGTLDDKRTVRKGPSCGPFSIRLARHSGITDATIAEVCT